MARILVFDSGLGGLSVLAEIRKRLPSVSITYAADTAAFPFGEWNEDDLTAHLREVMRSLIAREAPDVVVVACNTASTAALAAMRADQPNIPFVGTVPALKPAATLTQTRVIGLLATPGTVISPYVAELHSDVAADCTLVRVGASKLATLAEAKMRGEMIDLSVVSSEIAPLFKHSALDVVVLGCTHYPLLARELAEIAPRKVAWLDSGAAIARQTERVLAKSETLPFSSGPDRSLVTAAVEGVDIALLGYGLPSPEVL